MVDLNWRYFKHERPKDLPSVFRCKEDAITGWFKAKAVKQTSRGEVVLSVALEGKCVVGFFASKMHSHDSGRVDKDLLAQSHGLERFHCFHIEALGVLEGHEGKGIGQQLMGAAIVQAKAVASFVGFQAVSLEALESSVGFYERMGFIHASRTDEAKLMFLPAKRLFNEGQS